MQAREQEPDLILLDLGLPDFDGSDVVSRMRADSRVPIIVLTARDTVEEKIRLLTLGADDYLVKPFHSEELIARIHTQLRRRAGGGLGGLTVGEPTLFPAQRRASYKGTELLFSPTELGILLVLARQRGRVYRREELNQALWEGWLPEGSHVIDLHMANIRAKLREVGAYQVVRTVRGIGYALRG